jgi:hemerythrin superfamily protein
MSTDKTNRTTGQDAIALLTADHKAVKALFKQYEALAEQDDADDQKATLVARICDEIAIHAQVEEEIFYPAVREAIDDDALMDEADVEHASAKDLIAQLETMSPDDDHYDAKVTVLGEQIDHHVEEEQNEMFAKARKADVDVQALGARIATRKAELKAELGLDDDAPAGAKSASGKAPSGGRKAPAARK